MLVKITLVLLVPAVAASINTYNSNLPDRLQWLNNDGYCGEVSAIMAGLKYGQYYSQYDVRDISARVRTDQLQEKQYYLIGVNDEEASEKLRLGYIEYPSSELTGAEQYLSWVKTMMRKGYAVTITVFMNYYLSRGP
jgi:hypothetical protein